MQNLEPTKKIPRFVIFLMISFWLLQVWHFVFGNFRFYNESLNSLAETMVLVVPLTVGIFILLPVWQGRKPWKPLAILMVLLPGFMLFCSYIAPDESHHYYSLIQSEPIYQNGYLAKLEKRFDTVVNDCRTKVVLCYERNYWSFLKETKDIYSISPCASGTFDINANGDLLTLRVSTEDSNHTKIVKTFPTDWNQAKSEAHN